MFIRPLMQIDRNGGVLLQFRLHSFMAGAHIKGANSVFGIPFFRRGFDG